MTFPRYDMVIIVLPLEMPTVASIMSPGGYPAHEAKNREEEGEFSQRLEESGHWRCAIRDPRTNEFFHLRPGYAVFFQCSVKGDGGEDRPCKISRL